MLARTKTATPWGIEARLVTAEVDIRNGIPRFQIVGLPDASVRESRERVHAAIKNCGFAMPPRVVVVNLAPADEKKEGNHMDLGIALALLTALGHLEEEALDGVMAVGELGLDGAVRPVRGGLAVADLATREDLRQVILPAESAPEAAALGTVPVVPVRTLPEAVAHLTGESRLTPLPAPPFPTTVETGGPDLADVRGQEAARRALEIAAAGGHNVLLIGPPGSGKTMLARRLPGILPPLDRSEAIAVTKIHSRISEAPPPGLLTRRPFRSPHTGTSTAGMIGGGSTPRPGEVSLAHLGVLFLDELPEFRRDTLEALRQPLEDGKVSIVRAKAALCFPARFTLVASMNPCPCGHLGDRRHPCRCTPHAVERYRGKVSGPLLDRIDLHIEVPAVTLGELHGQPGEPSEAVAQRVLAARQRQRQRCAESGGGETGDGNANGGERREEGGSVWQPVPTNAALSTAAVHRHCKPDDAGTRLLERAFHRLGLSARAHERILKVARTIADLAEEDRIGASHVAEAIQYRALDRRLEL